MHADHVTGSGRLRQNIPSCKSVIAEVSEAKASVKVNDGDILKFGKFDLEVRATPGHTNGEFLIIEPKNHSSDVFLLKWRKSEDVEIVHFKFQT